jgi:aerobic carbon-monoxide dehydrogenase medium subunit
LPGADLVFTAPSSLTEALGELAGTEEAIAMGGGTSVALLLKNDLIAPRKIVWLGRVPRLRDITRGPDGELIIGATATLRELAASALVLSHFPALAHAASQVGNPRVRAVATVGGALVHADPRQDLPPVMLAIGARLRIIGPGGEREIPFAGFHTGFMETTLAEDELITQVVIPVVPGRRASYARFTPGSADDYPTVSAAASLTRDGDGRITAAALSLGGVAGTALLAAAASTLVGVVPGQQELDAVAAAAAAETSPFGDQRGSARYKKAMAREWSRRVLRACLEPEGAPLPPGVVAGLPARHEVQFGSSALRPGAADGGHRELEVPAADAVVAEDRDPVGRLAAESRAGPGQRRAQVPDVRPAQPSALDRRDQVSAVRAGEVQVVGEHGRGPREQVGVGFPAVDMAGAGEDDVGAPPDVPAQHDGVACLGDGDDDVRVRHRGGGIADRDCRKPLPVAHVGREASRPLSGPAPDEQPADLPHPGDRLDLSPRLIARPQAGDGEHAGRGQGIGGYATRRAGPQPAQQLARYRAGQAFPVEDQRPVIADAPGDIDRRPVPRVLSALAGPQHRADRVQRLAVQRGPLLGQVDSVSPVHIDQRRAHRGQRVVHGQQPADVGLVEYEHGSPLKPLPGCRRSPASASPRIAVPPTRWWAAGSR